MPLLALKTFPGVKASMLKGPNLRAFTGSISPRRSSAVRSGEPCTLMNLSTPSILTALCLPALHSGHTGLSGAQWYAQSLSSAGGRSFAMDRDRRWEKVELAYNAMLGHGNITSLSPIDYIKKSYESKIYDEFVEPVLFDKSSSINEGDCIFFLNFRPDRAIQLSLSFCLPGFKDFTQKFIPPYFLCMTPYVTDEVELPILFNKEAVVGGLSEHLSSLGLKQYKIAETEKFAHITFFFNGGKKEPFDAEDRCLVPSPKEVATYNEKPEMSAPEVTKNLLSALDNKSYSFFLVNYANSDMVGHTGDFKAAIKAVETLDQQVAKLLKKCEENNIALILTADHGNSDQMAYEDDSPHTSHTASKVPFVIFHNDIINGSKLVEEGHIKIKAETVKREDGGLAVQYNIKF